MLLIKTGKKVKNGETNRLFIAEVGYTICVLQQEVLVLGQWRKSSLARLTFYSRMKLMKNVACKPSISLQIKRTSTHKQIVNKIHLSNNFTSLPSWN